MYINYIPIRLCVKITHIIPSTLAECQIGSYDIRYELGVGVEARWWLNPQTFYKRNNRCFHNAGRWWEFLPPCHLDNLDIYPKIMTLTLYSNPFQFLNPVHSITFWSITISLAKSLLRYKKPTLKMKCSISLY